jgi:tripartite ATP-independent transporter DctP family solute receptor
VKKWSISIVIALLAFTTAACGGNKEVSAPSESAVNSSKAPAASSPAPAKDGKKYEWIVGTAVVETVNIAKATNFFAQRVEELSQGQIKMKVYHGGTLGSDREIVENVLDGSVQVAVPGQTILAGWYKPAEVWIFPNLYKDAAHKDRVWDALKEEYATEVAAKTNLRPLLAIPRAPRTLSSNKVIKTPDDLKGLKIRVPETPMWIGTFERYGASAVGMALTEVYSALETKVIDGQENPIEDSFNTGFFEVNSHLALTNHMMQDNVVLLNEDIYQSLSDELKQVLKQAATETEQKYRKIVYDTEAEFLQKVKDKGIIVNEVDQEAFKAKVVGLEDQFPDIKGWLAKIRAVQ